MDNLRKKIALSLVMALIIVIFIFFYGLREPDRQEAATLRIQQEGIQNGKNTFLTACSSCHGQQAQGGVGPALKNKDAALVQRVVRNGKGIMPAFSPNQITGRELEDIALFLSSLSSSPATSPTATAVPAPTSPTPATPTPSKVDPAILRAKGEEIFQKTAGGVGCKTCHGTDGKGTNSGPDIRGKTADDIRRALGGDAMSFIYLTEEDIQAVAAYMKYLESQR